MKTEALEEGIKEYIEFGWAVALKFYVVVDFKNKTVNQVEDALFVEYRIDKSTRESPPQPSDGVDARIRQPIDRIVENGDVQCRS